MNTAEPILPDKPSELIRLSVKDMDVVRKDKRYTLNMLNWHLFNGKKCLVCLVGCVLSHTYKVSVDNTVRLRLDDEPVVLRAGEIISPLNKIKLMFLNKVRYGYFLKLGNNDSFKTPELNHSSSHKWLHNERAGYRTNYLKFKSCLLDIAFQYEKIGH